MAEEPIPIGSGGDDEDPVGQARRLPYAQGVRLRSAPVSQLAAKSILDWIVDENLQPGEMLPNEATMASGLRVARATLREALHLLTTHGVIEVRTGRGGGPMVQEPSAATFAQQSLMLLQFMRVRYQDLLEGRQILEPAIAQAAARHGNSTPLAELDDCAVHLSDTVSDPIKYSAALERFHLLLGETTGNSAVSVINSMFVKAFMVIHDEIPISHTHRRKTIDWYTRIAEAVLTGNQDDARSITYAYLTHYRRWLDRHSPASLTQTVRWTPGR